MDFFRLQWLNPAEKERKRRRERKEEGNKACCTVHQECIASRLGYCAKDSRNCLVARLCTQVTVEAFLKDTKNWTLPPHIFEALRTLSEVGFPIAASVCVFEYFT